MERHHCLQPVKRATLKWPVFYFKVELLLIMLRRLDHGVFSSVLPVGGVCLFSLIHVILHDVVWYHSTLPCQSRWPHGVGLFTPGQRSRYKQGMYIDTVM